MPLYNYIKGVKYKLALSLGFGLLGVGLVLSIKLILKERGGIVYESFLGVSSTYIMLFAFLMALFTFFKLRRKRYYQYCTLGLIVSTILSILEFLNKCECDYLYENDISVCQWSALLFLGMLIFKRLE